jgi:hypothetical protein
MSIFHRKTAPDVYSYAGVSKDKETAASIQHNVDLLRYMADHPHSIPSAQQLRKSA